MHACGHDGHMAILLSLSTFLSGYFSFFFQLKSEAIQSSQSQGRLNEVIRTLTQVRRRISNP